MNKQGCVVDNKFCAMFLCNFKESLTLRILAESKEKYFAILVKWCFQPCGNMRKCYLLAVFF